MVHRMDDMSVSDDDGGGRRARDDSGRLGLGHLPVATRHDRVGHRLDRPGQTSKKNEVFSFLLLRNGDEKAHVNDVFLERVVENDRTLCRPFFTPLSMSRLDGLDCGDTSCSIILRSSLLEELLVEGNDT